MNISSTVRESRRALQSGRNCPLVDPVSFYFFLNTRNPLRELLQIMPNLRHVLAGLEFANRDQTSVDELLRTTLGFGDRMQQGPTKSRQEAVIKTCSRHQWTKIRRLCNRLDSAEATHLQLYHHFCDARDTLAIKKEEFGTLTADYYRLTNGRRLRASDTNDDWKAK